jgi:hypothetical protein
MDNTSESLLENTVTSNGVLDNTVQIPVQYKFKEDLYLQELLTYISSTYNQHYSLSKIQSTEFIMDAGHGEGFTIGNIIKYAQRYGKKGGKNRADILKVCHYAIMMLYVHDHFNSEEE